MTKVNLLDFQDKLKVRSVEGQTYLFDPVRKKNIMLTPEELVRQLTIQYLHLQKGYPIGVFSVEKTIKLNDTVKRYDIVIYKKGLPYLLVECKRPEIKLDEVVCAQIARYNIVLQVPFLMITNGPDSFFFGLDEEKQKFVAQKEIPDHPSTI